MPDGQPLYANTSVCGSAAVTGPAGGALICTVTPPLGLNDVEIWFSLSGTSVVAADSNNVMLKYGSTTLIAKMPYAATTAGTTNAPGPFKIRLEADGVTALTLNAVGAATGTSIYSGLITTWRAGY